MTKEVLDSDSVDPLSGLKGPLLFPRTIRASADLSLPADSKDLDSIHNFVKSLKELRSPEKLMNEAKKIMDGGLERLESNFTSSAGNVGVTNVVAAKGKDRPQERRPDLGLARKRVPFSLRTSISQPVVTLETTPSIDDLEDPDEFFDAFERNEKARKEIQKQLGRGMGSLNLPKPTKNEGGRRPGILGKTYKYKHRYSSTPSENDAMWMSSQETVDQNIPSVPKYEPQVKLVDPDPNSDADLEEVELAESMKKTESQVCNILEELLSGNDEDIERRLQEHLKIKPLDLENLYMNELPDVERTDITASESSQKRRRSSVAIDSMINKLNKKLHMEREPVANPVNPVSSPTPPRNPFASVSLLQKRILQPSPLIDPYSPLDIDLSARRNTSPAQLKDKLSQADAPEDLAMSSELESHVGIGNIEPAVSNMEAHEVMGTADSLPEQFVGEKSLQRHADSSPNASPAYPNDKLLGQVDALKDLGISHGMESNAQFGKTEPTISNTDAPEGMGNADGLPEQFVDVNASMQRHADSSPNASPVHPKEKLVGQVDAGKDLGISREMEPDAEFANTEPTITKADAQEVMENAKQHEVCAAKPLRGKRIAGEKRIRNSHPMRKSLAEAGTSFENGLRRSKRIKMRPLEYWKGERFLYGRVDNGFKLLGVRYISPGKGNEGLKVKPYMSESSDYKDILDLAARH